MERHPAASRSEVEAGATPYDPMSSEGWVTLFLVLFVTLPVPLLSHPVRESAYPWVVGAADLAMVIALLVVQHLRKRGVVYVKAEVQDVDAATTARVAAALDRRRA